MLAKQLLEFKNLDLKSIRRPDLDALAESLSRDEIMAEYVRFLSGKRAVTEQEEREAMALMFSGDEQAKDTFLLYYMPLVVEIALRYTGAGPCLPDRVEEGNQTLVDIVEEEKVITPGEILERIHRRIFILVLRSHITGLVGKEPVEEYLPDLSFKMSEKEMEILKRLCSAEDYLEELLQTAVDYSVSPQRIATVWNRAQRIIRQSRRNRQRSLKDFLGNPENN